MALVGAAVSGRVAGTVHRWHADLGYGFIQPDDNGKKKQIFVHKTQVLCHKDRAVLQANLRVLYSISKRPYDGQLEARWVTNLDGGKANDEIQCEYPAASSNICMKSSVTSSATPLPSLPISGVEEQSRLFVSRSSTKNAEPIQWSLYQKFPEEAYYYNPDQSIAPKVQYIAQLLCNHMDMFLDI